MATILYDTDLTAAAADEFRPGSSLRSGDGRGFINNLTTILWSNEHLTLAARTLNTSYVITIDHGYKTIPGPQGTELHPTSSVGVQAEALRQFVHNITCQCTTKVKIGCNRPLI